MKDLCELDYGVFNCPNCKDQWIHHIAVYVFTRDNEDGDVERQLIQTETFMPHAAMPEPPENPSPRRGGVIIRFECETCRAISDLAIIQHKGQTYDAWVDVWPQTYSPVERDVE